MTILERIQKLREEHGGISINRLEKEAGVSRGSIAKWDTSTPSYDKAKKVADYFGVTTDYILTGNENKPAKNGELTPYMLEVIDLFKDIDAEKQSRLLEIIRNARDLMGD